MIGPTLDRAVRRVLQVGLILAAALLALGLLAWAGGGDPRVPPRATVVAASTLGVVLAGLLRAGPEARASGTLFVGSLGAALVVAELSVQAYQDRSARAGLSREEAERRCPWAMRARVWCLRVVAAGGDFDSRLGVDVLESLRAQGEPAWPSLNAGWILEAGPLVVGGDSVLPLAPEVPDAVSVLCNEWGRWITIQADGEGFVNPEGARGPEAAVFVGDSFVHGFCVDAEDAFVSRLRARLDRPVVNLGVQGAGPLYELAVLREFGLPLRPRRVFWVFFEGNDLGDLDREQADPWLRRYLDEPEFSQGLRDRTSPLRGPLERRVTEITEEARGRLDARARRRARAERESEGWSSRLIRLQGLRTLVRSGLDRSVEPPPPADPLVPVLRRARDDVRAVGADLVFVYLPGRRRWAGGTVADRSEILRAARDLGLEVIDLTPAFEARPDPLALFPYGATPHYTPEGHRVVADRIEAWILDGGR